MPSRLTACRQSWTWSAAVSTHPDWIRDRKFVVPVLFATHKPSELKDSALVTELAHNDKERQALELILSNQTLGRPYAAPPHIPGERVTALRRAFDAVLKDTRFLAEAEKSMGGFLGKLSHASPRSAYPLGFHRAATMTGERLVLLGIKLPAAK